MREFREIVLVLLLIAVAVFGALNFKGCSSGSDKKSEAPTTNNTPAKGTNERTAEGKALFRSNCAACHSLKVNVTGPALAGVRARWKAAGDYQGKTGEQWLHIWIKDWNAAVAAGYPYAITMANSNLAQMNNFSNLKDEEIESILAYIDAADSIQAPTP